MNAGHKSFPSGHTSCKFDNQSPHLFDAILILLLKLTNISICLLV